MDHVHAARQAAPDKSLTTVVYALQALYFVTGVAMFAAVAINYWKKDEVRGTWLESHFRWQMDTFWRFVIASTAAAVLIVISFTIRTEPGESGGGLRLILPLVAAVFALHGWYVYRIAKGWSRLSRAEPMS